VSFSGVTAKMLRTLLCYIVYILYDDCEQYIREQFLLDFVLLYTYSVTGTVNFIVCTSAVIIIIINVILLIPEQPVGLQNKWIK